MKPAAFEYHSPDTLEEALDLLAQHGDEAKVLAGGQSLIPAMNFRLAQPAILVDLGRLSELSYLRPTDDGGIDIGTMTRQRQVERSPLVAERAPLVALTMPFIAHPQIRNRGTFGGSIAHADPASELPAVALALGAELTLCSSRGERRLPASEFFTSLFETALAPDEMLRAIHLPTIPPRTGYSFQEVSRRNGDFALVGVAANITLGLDGLCSKANLVYLSVGPGPVAALQASRQLLGQEINQVSAVAAAGVAASRDIDPPGDIHATPAYRRHLARVLGRKAILEAAGRAAGGQH